MPPFRLSPKLLILPAMLGMPLSTSAGFYPLAVSNTALNAKSQQTSNQAIHLRFESQALPAVLKDLQSRSGIAFELAPGLVDATLSKTVNASDWTGAVKQLLQGFNWVGFVNPDGTLKQIVITGRAGNGIEPGTIIDNQTTALFSYPENQLLEAPASTPRPAHLENLPTGSVMPVKFDQERLANLGIGDVVTLTLPSGQHDVVHDNRIYHENGDFSWIGYLQDHGKQYRVILTFGEDGSSGRIVSPQGIYRVEAARGVNWLVDINAAGLDPVNLDNDGLVHPNDKNTFVMSGRNGMAGLDHHGPDVHYDPAVSPPIDGTLMSAAANGTLAHAQSAPTESARPQQSAATAQTNPTQLDVMVLFTPAMQAKGGVQTRLNNLVATANQAYNDSQVNIRLRMVHSELVNYADANINSTALNDLTRGSGAFAGIAALRQQHGADLVSLVRPFNRQGHASCGVAWVGGARGTSFRSTLGYSVVSDGIDGRYFCTDYTFAHELGHNMGSNHDRTNSSFEGKFPYSYGYGLSGQFGTVMSYLSPKLGVFSNPDLDCRNNACGIDEKAGDSANNALSLNNTAESVAAFMQSVYSDPEPVVTKKPDQVTVSGTDPKPEPKPEPKPTTNPKPQAQPATLGYDFDSDGHADIVWRRGGKTRVWLMNGATRKSDFDISQIKKQFVADVTADFNGDQKPDVWWRNHRTGENVIAFMDGRETVSMVQAPGASSQWRIIFSGDFNGDGKADLIWQNKRSKQYVTLLMDGHRILNLAVLKKDNINWRIVGVADFNGDQNTDVVWQNTRLRKIAIGQMAGTIEIATTEFNTDSGYWRVKNTGDFNGDQHSDIVLRHHKTGELAMWLMNTDQLAAQQVFMTEKNRRWRIAGSGDFNNDGRSDLLWQHRSGSVKIMLMDGFAIKARNTLSNTGLGWGWTAIFK